MRGYSRNEMEENLDEYEEDDYDQDEDEEEAAEEEYEEKEDPKPTREELEYLELRQRLKDDLRKQMKKESGASVSNSQDKKKKLPYDNYGSFFGPSQPVIAQRVILESKSLLETRHLAGRILNSHQSSKKSPASTTTGAKHVIRDPPPKVVNEVKQKVQKLKDMRDYSFLWSDDAELPAPTKLPPPRNVSVPNSDAQPAQAPYKSKQSMSNLNRSMSNGREVRKLPPTNHHVQTKAVHHQVTPASRPKLASADPRKQLGNNNGNGPGRPSGQKGLPSKMHPPTKMPTSKKMPASAMDKKTSSMSVKKPVPGVQKAPLPKLHSSVHKQHSESRRELREPDKAKPKPTSRQPVSSSRPQIKPPKQVPSRASMQMDRQKKRPSRQYSDEEDDDGPQAISIIRKMFGYNPNKYAGDDEDDSDMEANFDDIMKEERKSAMIARKEDEIELQRIEEEERLERLRKAKKRKLSQSQR